MRSSRTAPAGGALHAKSSKGTVAGEGEPENQQVPDPGVIAKEEKMAYKASRGGHAPGHLREALIEYISDVDGPVGIVDVEGQEKPLRWLLGQLWNCTDIMPSMFCGSVPVYQGSTYGRAVREMALDNF